MGVLHLWRILEPTKEVCPLEDIANKRLCIDLSYWLCQLANVTHGDPSRRQYLRGLFHRVRTLMGLNCDLIFVADGEIPAIKLAAYHHRLEFPSRKNRPVLQPLPIKENAGPGRRHKTSEFGCMVEEAKALGRALGIPIITSFDKKSTVLGGDLGCSPEEAEAQCAILNADGLCDICCTGDSDSFLFGATCVMREMTILPGRSACELYAAEKIRNILGFGRNSLEKATQVVKASGDEFVLKNMKDVGVRQHAKKVIGKGDASMARRKKKTENTALENSLEDTLKSGEQTLALQCVKAYLYPKCHAVDSDPIRKAFGQDMKVHLDDLAELLERLLEWPRTTTMNYILPKLAERELRRTVLETEAKEKLVLLTGRSNDFQQGRMPQPKQYQIAKVLKQHVQYGIPHYKVTWEGTPAVEETIVKAHLVERAYPDKVAEFKALKAQQASKRSTKAGKEGVVATTQRTNNSVDDKNSTVVDNAFEARQKMTQSNGDLWHVAGEEASLLSPRPGVKDLFWKTGQGTTTSGETYSIGDERDERFETPGRSSEEFIMDIRSERWELRTTDVFYKPERVEWMSPDGERELLEGGWLTSMDGQKRDITLKVNSVDEDDSGDDGGVSEDIIDVTASMNDVSISKFTTTAVHNVAGKIESQQTVEDNFRKQQETSQSPSWNHITSTKAGGSQSSFPDDSPTIVYVYRRCAPFDQSLKHAPCNIYNQANRHPANFINLASPSPAKGGNGRYLTRN